MRLVSLSATAFKGLEHVELADLAPDLNLVVGPNEAGKTRLVSALRYALFERYKGESEDKKALRSYGSSASPSVEVRFEAGGTLWTVRKQFLKQASARLEGGGRTWTDEDAEAKLRDLLGTKPIAGRREIDQFLGLWPLLWVKQGEGGLAPQAHMNEDARARLRDVLAGQVDLVAAGPLGERIVARAEAERNRYYTTQTGKETGELEAARKQVSAAEAERAAALAKRSEAHAAADELAGIARQLAEIDAKVGPQRARVTEAAARLARVKDLASRLRTHEADVARRRAEIDLAERALSERKDLAERIAATDRRLVEETADRNARAEAKLGVAQSEASAAERAEAAGAALERAHVTSLRARRRARLEDAARREREVGERLARARKAEKNVSELRAQLAQARIDEARIGRLRRAADSLGKATAALTAASASLRLHAARDLVVSGERVGEGEERSWTADAPLKLVVEGVGAFELRPGGTDLDVRRAREQEARLAFAAELERSGVASLEEGEERFARATALAAQLQQAEPHLAEAAPDGVGALEEEARARATERAELEGSEESTETAPTSVERADADLLAATDAATRARTERDALRAEIARVEEAIVRHDRALGELTRARAIDAERIATLPPEVALVEGLAAAKAAWADARTLSEALTAELATMRESGADLALEQETRVRDRLEADRAEKHARSLALEAVVRVHGGEDLHERVQRAEAELEEKAALLRATEARALAARELASALHAARREVQQLLVAPVIARARPYVEALMPGRRLRMDENWHVVGLTSGDHEEDFEVLSGGAKEQVSILARLALAEVLGEAEPLPVVLDDCLVNTDRVRLAEMMRILYRASRKFQILVFSCHDLDLERLGESRRFDLGGPPR